MRPYILRLDQLPTNGEERRAVQQMSYPVRCGCGRVYDLGTVTVTARYADCSMWKTPCCKRLTDDRPAWHEGPGITKLDKETGQPL